MFWLMKRNSTADTYLAWKVLVSLVRRHKLSWQTPCPLPSPLHAAWKVDLAPRDAAAILTAGQQTLRMAVQADKGGWFPECVLQPGLLVHPGQRGK